MAYRYNDSLNVADSLDFSVQGDRGGQNKSKTTNNVIIGLVVIATIIIIFGKKENFDIQSQW